MNEVLLILGMTAVTFGVRYPALAIIGRMRLPDWLVRALRFVPIAVLTAISLPVVLMPQGALDISPANAQLIAGTLSALVAWRTRSLLWTILVGMGVFFLWKTVIAV